MHVHDIHSAHDYHKVISGKDAPSPLTGEGEGGGEREA